MGKRIADKIPSITLAKTRKNDPEKEEFLSFEETKKELEIIFVNSEHSWMTLMFLIFFSIVHKHSCVCTCWF